MVDVLYHRGHIKNYIEVQSNCDITKDKYDYCTNDYVVSQKQIGWRTLEDEYYYIYSYTEQGPELGMKHSAPTSVIEALTLVPRTWGWVHIFPPFIVAFSPAVMRYDDDFYMRSAQPVKQCHEVGKGSSIYNTSNP